MLPPVTLVDSVEVIRDGGSLGASFQCANGSSYGLLFRIHFSDAAAGFREALGYLTPVLVDGLSRTEITLSWQHASALLSQMKPLLRDNAHAATLDVMLDIASQEGALTPMARKHFPSLYGRRKWSRATPNGTTDA